MYGARGRAFLRAAALLTAAAAVVLWARHGAVADAHVLPPADASLSAVASGFSGKQLSVRCWPAERWEQAVTREVSSSVGIPARSVLGFAAIGGDGVDLAPAICDRLRSLAAGATPPDRLLSAAALVTLAHETWHARGVESEAVAECRAIQTAAGVAGRLGVAPPYARAAIGLYWSRYGEERRAYRSPGCRDGGSLDLRPASSLWP